MATKQVFVDTGAWFALAIARDADHDAAVAFAGRNRADLITTDFIVDELLTLFVRRGFKHIGVRWLNEVLTLDRIEMVRVDASVFDEACRIYSRYKDKQWSLTDCTSLVVMRRLGIQAAFSFDAHFLEFGAVHVLP